ncbi:MAG: hypothetical protein EPO29_10435 [Betaproteobacteria bacterium]|nr:MAG: hypothetical protein EPO29_10435 [Betaproteobacteria bacterium]
MIEVPGRSCPVSYRYGAQALAACAAFEAETLWVAGGLYGNRCALERLLELYDAEPGEKALVFNGDFHWFDCDAADFAAVDSAVLRYLATRGNVETELADPDAAAGCGCGYPDWVSDADVARSNRILERLRGAAGAQPRALRSLGALPMYRAAQVAGERVVIVHGDADSLAGWGFSQERLATPEGVAAAREALRGARAHIIACSHTCLPVLQSCGEAGAIANNGAAGMPNFRGTRFGLATRISVRPHSGALHAARIGRAYVEAQPIAYDHARWLGRFLELWPQGSDAHESYHQRIVHGPAYDAPRALRAA